MTIETNFTPDLGFKVDATRLDKLFEEAGVALTNVIVDIHTVLRKESKSIDLFAPTIEELMHNWLVEITYLFDYKQFVICEYVVQIFFDGGGEVRLHASVSGEQVDAKRHSLRNRHKLLLVSNHKIEEQEDGRWTAKICVNS